MTDAEETPPVAATPFKQLPANLPPPKSLVVDDNLASNWKQWKKVWQRYEIVMGIYKQEDLVRGLRVSKLLAVIGEDAVKAYLIRLSGAKLRRKIYFTTFWRSLISLFVLLTTANYPDVMMPSYHLSRWSAVFFIIYISLVLYFLMNLLLAVVYDTFTNIEKEKFMNLFLHKRKAVRQAHNLLRDNNNNLIPWTHFEEFMASFKPSSCMLSL
ncbi:PREDICTED: two pore calcium channel protein 1-like [Acropora digitifera]|uniref:two pore calcium channel protein 1-like n=1 Tax=Acropora digitifera TaxID=70779 RepID=UPI00077A3DBB|nr:PREDICTED: two pore calcium channel protein 1-like [Acropora digitifera]